MQVTRLSVYPVKSLGGVDLETVAVTPQGLDGDRRFVLLDPDGNSVSGREVNALLGIEVSFVPDGVRLTAPSGESIEVGTPSPDAPRIPTRVSRIDDLTLADPAAAGRCQPPMAAGPGTP
jgi:MOSC domain-containing protein